MDEVKTKTVHKRSPIWLHFIQLARDRGKCTICGKVISTSGGSTSNLRRHVRLKHKGTKVFKLDYEAAEKQFEQVSMGVIKNGETTIENIDNLENSELNVSARSNDKNIYLNSPKNGEQSEAVEEVVIVQSCVEENYNDADELFHDYTEIPAVEIEIEPDVKLAASSAAISPQLNQQQHQQPQQKKPNILRQQRQLHIKSNNNNNQQHHHKLITHEQATTLLNINNSNKHDVSNKKAVALEQIAYNLGRMATAFEKIADYLHCTTNTSVNMATKQQRRHSNVNMNGENTYITLGEKVNEVIMKVLEGENISEEQ